MEVVDDVQMAHHAAQLAASLRERAGGTTACSVGVEEEFLLVASDEDDLTSMAFPVAERAGDDQRVRLELPPCQIEMATPPRTSLAEIEDDLLAARSAVVGWSDGLARPMAAAVHPTQTTFGDDPVTERGHALLDRYGWLARRQVVGSLQVHVAFGDADVLLAVHNALRSYLPHLIGLAAAAPILEAADRGLATVRPVLAASLPRQGTPPALTSWEWYAGELTWGSRSGTLGDPTQWWWDLRPHPTHGTLEVRAADAQPRVQDAMGVVELTVALTRWLADRARAGDLPKPAASWRIDENRWSAVVGGLDGRFADVDHGRPAWARDEVEDLVTTVEPWAERGLGSTLALLDDPPHRRLRTVGPAKAVDWLTDQFAR